MLKWMSMFQNCFEFISYFIVFCSVQTRYPTYVGDVAEVCLQLCEQRISQVDCILISYPINSLFIFQNRNEVHGIFHFSGKEKYTKFQMALLIASLFQLPIDHIERDQGLATNTNVQRPDNAALDTNKLSHELGVHIEQAKFETTIKRCLEAFL
jgi:S-adenosylmethionine synthetase